MEIKLDPNSEFFKEIKRETEERFNNQTKRKVWIDLSNGTPELERL